MNAFQIERSRATEPLFYRAPYPEVLPRGMSVMEFQLAGVEYALSRPNALIGDAPGLTKTAQSIMLDNAIESTRTLCVVPASLRLNWEREIWNWSTLENVSTYPVLSAKDGISDQADFVIISYNLLNNVDIMNALLDLRWDHLILDEAHALKDYKGNKRTKAICAPDMLPCVVGRTTMLSGTILPNQPIECYNACRLLDWDCIDKMSAEDFREYYYEKGQGYIVGPVTKYTDDGQTYTVREQHWSDEIRNVPRNMRQLQDRLRSRIMVRRLPDQVYPEMPEVRWHPFPLETNSRIRQALRHPGWKPVSQLLDMDAGAFDSGIPIDGELSTIRRELGEAKAPGCVDYINEMVESGTKKIIVAAWHRSVLEYLKDKLKQHGLVYMDGRTSTVKKQWVVDEFQDNVNIRIILGQSIPLGMGWTLTAAQDVVNCEPEWVPGNNDQINFRIRRPSQEGDMLRCHLPVVPNSLDERIISRAISKSKNIFEVLDAQ